MLLLKEKQRSYTRVLSWGKINIHGGYRSGWPTGEIVVEARWLNQWQRLQTLGYLPVFKKVHTPAQLHLRSITHKLRGADLCLTHYLVRDHLLKTFCIILSTCDWQVHVASSPCSPTPLRYNIMCTIRIYACLNVGRRELGRLWSCANTDDPFSAHRAHICCYARCTLNTSSVSACDQSRPGSPLWWSNMHNYKSRAYNEVEGESLGTRLRYMYLVRDWSESWSNRHNWPPDKGDYPILYHQTKL